MACPKCGSEDWKLVSLVYTQGLNSPDTPSIIGGPEVGNRGIGKGQSRYEKTETHQSHLTASAAPPKPQSGKYGIVLIPSLILFALPAYLFLGKAPGIFSALLISLILLPVERDIHKAHKKLTAKNMADWEKKRMCQRCGDMYQPE